MEVPVRIRPAALSLGPAAGGGAGRTARSLFLPGTPRGAVLLVAAEGLDTDEAMNHLGLHGYESVAATADPGAGSAAGLPLVRELAGMLTGRGWRHEQMAVLGFGAAGAAALAAATAGVFGAAVSVGPLPPGPPTGTVLRTPWLGLHGDPDEDGAAPAAALRRSLDASSEIHFEVVRYPGVPNDFYRDRGGALDHAAAYDGWQRIVEWLDARVVPRPTPLAEAWEHRRSHARDTV